MNLRLFAAGLLTAAAACAPAASPPGGTPLAVRQPQQCFFASTVSSYREAGDRAVNLRAGRNAYQLELFAPCPELGRAQKILLDSRAGGSSICTGLDVEVIVPTSIGPRRCPGRSLRRLTDAETAALPAAQRP